MNITIIGAGIGGLTTALALRKKGIEAEIYESAPAFKDVGSGISLGMNATRVFKELGIYEQVLENGYEINSMTVLKPDMKVVSKTDFSRLEKKFGVKNVAIHRFALHNVLLDPLSDVPVHLGHQLTEIQQEDNKIGLTFQNGQTTKTDILIGSDGLRSAVRQSIFPGSTLRDAGQVCWRGIAKNILPCGLPSGLNEIWDKGKRFGFLPVNKTDLYWYAVLDKGLFRDGLSPHEVYSYYPKEIKDVIKQTPDEKIIFAELWDLKPITKWHQGNSCLTGDAAHATTPNMGQGACQAIESAYALANNLSTEQHAETAFQKYNHERLKKAHYVVNTSWRVGKLAQSRNPLMAFTRNLAMQAMSAKIKEQNLVKVFDLHYFN